jgi:choline dehydrogenase-like flavoprotein
VTTDKNSGLANGVWWIDKQSGRSSEAKAKVVVLCASTLASARILLNSRDERWPDGLGNSSGVLGQYVMDHVYSVGARGHLPLRDGAKAELASRPNGIYIPRFQNLGTAASKKSTYLRGYGYQGGENVTVFEHAYSQPGFGAGFKAAVKSTSVASFGVAGFGEMLPRKENRVTLDPEKRDAWDVPVLRMEVEHSDNERAMARDIALEAVAMLEAAGCEDITTDTEPGPPGLCIHEVGTARMGDDPRTSYLNEFNQSHEIKNLYVMDGSCYVTVGCVNPTLTMMALAVRACEHLIGEHKRGNLA